jgi:dTDP-4-amino-4,6-dideoxygalactose transaminase
VPLHSNVIEDCAHSFFWTEDTGERDWASDVAIFSLPKFFDIEGMAGGIIVRNPQLEARLRCLVAEAPADNPEVRTWMRTIISGAFNVDAPPFEKLFVDSAYELLLQFIRPDPFDLAGFPTSTDEIKAIGRKRRERFEFIVDFFGKKAFPDLLLWNYDRIMPFAVPYFSILDEKTREKVDNLLSEIGIKAGIYHVDARRDCRNPEYRPCILLPCHQNIPTSRLEEACRIIASF